MTSYDPITPPLSFDETLTQDLFSSNVFNKSMMKERLPKSIYKSLLTTIETGGPLDPSMADVVASAMKDREFYGGVGAPSRLPLTRRLISRGTRVP